MGQPSLELHSNASLLLNTASILHAVLQVCHMSCVHLAICGEPKKVHGFTEKCTSVPGSVKTLMCVPVPLQNIQPSVA